MHGIEIEQMISIGQEGESLPADAKPFCYTCITIKRTMEDGKWVALKIQSYTSCSLCDRNTNIVLKQTNELIYLSFIRMPIMCSKVLVCLVGLVAKPYVLKQLNSITFSYNSLL